MISCKDEHGWGMTWVDSSTVINIFPFFKLRIYFFLHIRYLGMASKYKKSDDPGQQKVIIMLPQTSIA